MPNGKTEKARAQVKPMQRTANDWITEGRLDVNKMRAMVVTSPGAGLHMEEREIPEPGAGEVRIRVHACGVCHGDAFIVEGKRPNLTYPRIPGHEVIGEIEAIAPGIAGWAIGERIGVGWFAGACGRCTPCRKGQAFACRTMRGATGLTRDGGYATHMLADVSAIARVPVELESVAAAPLLCAGVTTFNALRHCQAGPGDLLAVQGVGGLGHVALQFAARMGFRVVAINRGREKEALARKLGADDYIDSLASDPAAALQVMGGAAAILSTVTDGEAMAAVIGGLAPGGVLMMLGATESLTIRPSHLILNQASIKGWNAGNALDSEEMLRFSDAHAVHSINEIYPLEQANEAYQRMMTGKARFRVVLSTA